jgi:hypothetical protein
MLLFHRAGHIDGNDELLSSIASKATVILALLAMMMRNSDDLQFIASAQTPCFGASPLSGSLLSAY